MKNSLKYFSLWQKKRGELQIDDDPQKDWAEMHSLLDQHMPTSAVGETGTGSKVFKSLSVTFISLSAAAMVYVAAHVVELEKHKQSSFNYKRAHKTILNSDSVSNSGISDSLSGKSSAVNIKDSTLAIDQSASMQNAGQANTMPNETTGAPLSGDIGNKTPTVAGNKKNSIVANGQNRNQPAATGNSNRLVLASLAANKPKFGKALGIAKSSPASGSLIKP